MPGMSMGSSNGTSGIDGKFGMGDSDHRGQVTATKSPNSNREKQDVGVRGGEPARRDRISILAYRGQKLLVGCFLLTRSLGIFRIDRFWHPSAGAGAAQASWRAQFGSDAGRLPN
jgi:hypothetical protein